MSANTDVSISDSLVAPDSPVKAEQVAMLCNGTEEYGIGTIIKNYANGTKGMRFICTTQGPMYEWLQSHNQSVTLIHGLDSFLVRGSLTTLLRMPRAFARARRHAQCIDEILRPQGTRIVHTHWLPQQLTAGYMRSMGYRVVWQINNNMNPRRLLGLGVKLNHRLARWGTNLLLPASDFISGNWRGCGVPMRVVRNCAPAVFSQPNRIDAPPIRCVIAGRLDESKGHHLAVEAIINARRRGLDVHLDIFGGPLDGNDYVKQLRRRIDQENVSDVITLHGLCHDLRERHQSYHLGLQCRIDPEPCSLWVCETLRDGLPLVASASGGTPELIEDGVTGLLFRSGDGADLTEKLVELASNPTRLAEMRVATYERGSTRVTVERFIRETFEAYGDLLSG